MSVPQLTTMTKDFPEPADTVSQLSTIKIAAFVTTGTVVVQGVFDDVGEVLIPIETIDVSQIRNIDVSGMRIRVSVTGDGRYAILA